MWIVRVALNRPYTFIVVSLLILILSGVAIVQTPVDIFPPINIPVVGVVIEYTGLSPQDMQDRLASVLEREHDEQRSMISNTSSRSPIMAFRGQGFSSAESRPLGAIAEISSVSTVGSVRGMPAGTTPPYMLAYSCRRCSHFADRIEQQESFRTAIDRFGSEFPADRG